MLQGVLLIIALCVDAFAASLSYGADKIKIPLKSAVVISGIGSVFLIFSFLASALIQQFVPIYICLSVSFMILFCVGVSSLFQNSIKAYLKKRNNNYIFKFKYSNIDFVLDVYLDETKADADNSKVLSAKEAIYLAVALSMDSLITGFGSGFLMDDQYILVLALFIACILSIYLGCIIGRKLVSKSNLDISWLSGTILIILAFMKIL